MKVSNVFAGKSIFLIMVVLLTACGQKERVQKDEVRAVKLITVGSDSNISRRHYSGIVRAAQEAELSFRVSGQLQKFDTIAGQHFKEGDIIAKIDPRDYEAQAELAKSNLQGQQAQMALLKAGAREEDRAKMEAAVASAKSSYSAALAQFERYEVLFEKGDIGKADYDAQKQARDAAEANLKQAEKSLEIGEKGGRKEDVLIQSASIGGASAQFKTAQNSLEYTELKAPFDGVIAATYVNTAEEIGPNQKVVTIQDLTSLKIDVDVPEDIMLTINRYKRVKLVATFEALPGMEFPLTKDEVSTQADPATRTYKVTLAMEQQKGVKILPGMSATVVLDLQLKNNGDSSSFSIPANSVVAVEKSDPFVWIADHKKMTVKKTSVKTGSLSGDTIEILSGVKKGDLLVISGANYLKEGQKVRKYISKSEAGSSQVVSGGK